VDENTKKNLSDFPFHLSSDSAIIVLLFYCSVGANEEGTIDSE